MSPLLFPPVNEFVKRVRALKIHLLLIGHIRKNMPTMFGKEKAQRKMLESLPSIFYEVRQGWRGTRALGVRLAKGVAVAVTNGFQ